MQEQLTFDALSAASLENVTATAERWRTGLAGLTAVITGGLLLKGPADATQLNVPWRIVLTVLFGVGVAVSMRGFWLALRASAGVPATLRLDDLRREYGTVNLYRLGRARAAEVDLRGARRAAGVSAGLLTVAVLAWWWAPVEQPEGPTVVVSQGAAQSCGMIVASDATGLHLAAADQPARTTIPYASITSVAPAASCRPKPG